MRGWMRFLFWPQPSIRHQNHNYETSSAFSWASDIRGPQRQNMCSSLYSNWADTWGEGCFMLIYQTFFFSLCFLILLPKTSAGPLVSSWVSELGWPCCIFFSLPYFRAGSGHPTDFLFELSLGELGWPCYIFFSLPYFWAGSGHQTDFLFELSLG